MAGLPIRTGLGEAVSRRFGFDLGRCQRAREDTLRKNRPSTLNTSAGEFVNVSTNYCHRSGWYSLIRGNEKGTAEEQYANLRQTGEQILDLLMGENRIVITHGNGPQVGNLLLCIEAGSVSRRS